MLELLVENLKYFIPHLYRSSAPSQQEHFPSTLLIQLIYVEKLWYGKFVRIWANMHRFSVNSILKRKQISRPI